MIIDTKNLAGAKIIKIILIIFGGFIIALAIFWAGMLVGFRKAEFSYQWGGNYRNLFEGGPEHRPSRDFRGRGFIDANSAAGSVIQINTSTLIIKGDDSVEKNILISDKTTIRRGQETIQTIDIKADDRVVVLGVPSTTGQIEARLIRLMPKQ